MIPLLEWFARFLEGLKPSPRWDDRRLVAACVQGREEAWGALVQKYHHFVYAVVLEHGLDPEEAAELFQYVWLELMNELESLRAESSIRPRLVRLARQACARRRRHGVRSGSAGAGAGVSAERIAELERQQRLREVLIRLCPRCRDLVHLLFYSEPPLPNTEIAGRLKLSRREFDRQRHRCLKRLQRALGESAM